MVVHHALGSVCEDEVLGVVAPGPSRVLMPQRLLRLEVVCCDAGLLMQQHKKESQQQAQYGPMHWHTPITAHFIPKKRHIGL